MKIVALMDNMASEHRALTAEHGLSFFVDTGESQLVFDCGSTDNPLKNAEKLNISFERVDTVVISHGHYDHGGGFRQAASVIQPKILVTGKGFFEEKYAYNGETMTYLGTGFDRAFLEQKEIAHVACHDLYQIDSKSYVVGRFDRTHVFEQIPNRFVLLKEGDIVPDLFTDEVCLVIDTATGLVVVVGCAHPGIMNMLTSIHQRFQKKICAVFGGTHLMEADEERIEETLREMKALGVERTYMSHCSGEKAILMARETEGLIAAPLPVGGVVYL